MDREFSEPDEIMIWHLSALLAAAASLRGLSAIDDRVAWASGSNGAVLRTINGGATWTPVAVPDSAGISRSIRDDVLVAPFNDLRMAESLILEYKDDLGGVIVEPLQRLIPPRAGFLEGLRRITAEHGIPLNFDEVVTGFRFAYGGAQAYYGVTPDICTLGKIIGGGFPLAAIAGRADIMAHFDRGLVGDDGFLMQVGTLSGNPVAAAAGLATLNILKQPGVYDRVFATGRNLMDEFTRMLRHAGLPAQVVGLPPLFDVVFAAGDIVDYRATLRADKQMQGRFNRNLRQSGIFKGENKYYLSLAHDAADIGQTLAAFAAAVEAEARLRSSIRGTT